MKVDTIQTICESIQRSLDEYWYESKNNDMIQQCKTQDQRQDMMRFINLWIDSGTIRFRRLWIESKWHEFTWSRLEKKNYMMQDSLNRIRTFGNEDLCRKKEIWNIRQNLTHKTLWGTLRSWIARWFNMC